VFNDPSPALRSAHPRLEEGMKVEGNYKGKGKWFPGKIRRDRGDGTYDINYDDGETEVRVSEDMVRPIETTSARHQSPNRRSAHPRLEEGMKVEANYRGRGKFFAGKIRKDRGDGTFDIDYEDGESELRVKEEEIRVLRGGAQRVSPARKARLEEGAKVEANFLYRGRFFPGKIQRDRGDGTFDIDFDDGETEIW
jgi:hypothetical protein